MTNQCLYFYTIQPGDAGDYSVVATTATSGAHTSPPIALTVYYVPPTNARPQFILGSSSALVGEDVSLIASHGGSPSFVQWRFNGVDLPGETNATLALLAVTTNQAGQYSFTATNPGGWTTSSVVTITVGSEPPVLVFVGHPPSQSVVEGARARFTAYARSGPPPEYFLEQNGTNVAVWIAVGEPGIVLTSSNATNWHSHASGNTNSLKDATYAHGQWIVVGTQGTIVRSTDGVNWATTFTNPNYDLNDVAYCNGVFLVAGDGLNNKNGSVFRSSDGVAWTQLNYFPSKNLRGITFAEGRFLITGNDGLIVTTLDGTTFQNASFGRGGNLRAATWTRGLSIVVGNDGIIATADATDLDTWTLRASRTFENQHQVALLDGHLVVIGNRGGILQSGRFIAELEPPGFAGGSAHLPFKGVLRQEYQLEGSTNLTSWTPIVAFTNSSDRVVLEDPNAGQHPRRFYRVVAP